jgi:hypothetical protein
VLLAAWGGVVPFVGPAFGYNSNGSPSWHWSFLHAMLYVVPGAVGVVAGLLVLTRARAAGAAARGALGFAGLLLIASGAWFVVGPAAWPALGGAGAVFDPVAKSSADFVNQVGYNLGVGVLLAALGGMAMKASTGEREVVLGRSAPAAPMEREATRQGNAGPAEAGGGAPAAGSWGQQGAGTGPGTSPGSWPQGSGTRGEPDTATTGSWPQGAGAREQDDAGAGTSGAGTSGEGAGDSGAPTGTWEPTVRPWEKNTGARGRR